MSTQQIELALLEEQHLKKMYELQKERQLVNLDNPFKNQLYQMTPIPQLPTTAIGHLPYQLTKEWHLMEKPIAYIPKQIDRKIADKSMEGILHSWSYQNKYSLEDAYLRNIHKLNNQVSFQSELTLAGKREIDEILTEARLSSRGRHQMSLKEKYYQREYGLNKKIDL